MCGDDSKRKLVRIPALWLASPYHLITLSLALMYCDTWRLIVLISGLWG